MLRTAAVVVLLLSLPSCIAAIGNKGNGWGEVPTSALPMLREKVDVLSRVVALRQQQFDDVKSLVAASRAGSVEAAEAEIKLAEAKLRLLEARAEVQAVESRSRD